MRRAWSSAIFTHLIFTAYEYDSYHPLGFAYYPDGAHADADELEPAVVPPGSSSTCDTDMTCPAPMYFIEGEYQGTYSNIADLQEVSTNEDNFGLDEYEPLFLHPLVSFLPVAL